MKGRYEYTEFVSKNLGYLSRSEMMDCFEIVLNDPDFSEETCLKLESLIAECIWRYL